MTTKYTAKETFSILSFIFFLLFYNDRKKENVNKRGKEKSWSLLCLFLSLQQTCISSFTSFLFYLAFVCKERRKMCIKERDKYSFVLHSFISLEFFHRISFISYILLLYSEREKFARSKGVKIPIFVTSFSLLLNILPSFSLRLFLSHSCTEKKAKLN